MRGYPVSSFLFWRVERQAAQDYRFYRFLRKYRERFAQHNEDVSLDGADNFLAVLDGQQRLTSLYLGLKGSYAYKTKRLHWVDDEHSLPTRHLYLNIGRTLDNAEQEDGRIYQFSFLKQIDTNQEDLYTDGNETLWFRVGKILDLRDFGDFIAFMTELQLDATAQNIIAKLQGMVFTTPTINYFEESEQDLQKALNIFIRINSGGLPLDFSDLIMSIAVANWEHKDARLEIHSLVDRVKERGFNLDKSLVFKVYLYLYSKDITFKVTNFSADNARYFEQNWEDIRDAIETVFRLVQDFGFNDNTLVSKNALIPIIYYVYHRGITQGVLSQVAHKSDRQRIKKWLHVVTLKRILAGSTDTVLSQIRRAFTENVTTDKKLPEGITEFPVEAIAAEIKQDLSMSDEGIDHLLKTQIGDRYAFSILALLNPELDYKNGDFHKDHLHPISGFRKGRLESLQLEENQIEDFINPEHNNSILNLQMLNSNENQSKNDKSLREWVDLESQTKDRDQLLQRCYIDSTVSLDLLEFMEFVQNRKKNLKEELRSLLG